MLYTHARINTIEKLGAFLAEYQGPSLEEAMTMNMSELAKRGLNLQAVPLTEDEHQKKHIKLQDKNSAQKRLLRDITSKMSIHEDLYHWPT